MSSMTNVSRHGFLSGTMGVLVAPLAMVADTRKRGNAVCAWPHDTALNWGEDRWVPYTSVCRCAHDASPGAHFFVGNKGALHERPRREPDRSVV